MGCGGSRADAIEPRYYESWTRETESTWLTYTDSDAPPSNAAPDSGPEAGGLQAGVLEDGVSANGVPRSTAPGGTSNPEKKMSCGTQCPNPQSLGSGPLTQKQNGLRTTEVGHRNRADLGPETWEQLASGQSQAAPREGVVRAPLAGECLHPSLCIWLQRKWSPHPPP
uniref:BAALC binder of MAP3K1 and KLF4 n=3 Tax=Sus scrofa TaxID=9823 RepID=A0A8D1PCC5_PIG